MMEQLRLLVTIKGVNATRKGLEGLVDCDDLILKGSLVGLCRKQVRVLLTEVRSFIDQICNVLFYSSCQ